MIDVKLKETRLKRFDHVNRRLNIATVRKVKGNISKALRGGESVKTKKKWMKKNILDYSE